jgi:hypoxanthine phosphoribosyltransferase
LSKPDPVQKFIHPSEKEFARILDFYGIPWEYEPRTFTLGTNQDGSISEAFTPDFYLPEQDLYIELTTIRPQLSTNKNRKLKRLKERYPEVNIKLFKRREIRNLMIKYGLMEEANAIAGTDAQDKVSKDGNN